jgi:hypothetical protein
MVWSQGPHACRPPWPGDAARTAFVIGTRRRAPNILNADVQSTRPLSIVRLEDRSEAAAVPGAALHGEAERQRVHLFEATSRSRKWEVVALAAIE